MSTVASTIIKIRGIFNNLKKKAVITALKIYYGDVIEIAVKCYAESFNALNVNLVETPLNSIKDICMFIKLAEITPKFKKEELPTILEEIVRKYFTFNEQMLTNIRQEIESIKTWQKDNKEAINTELEVHKGIWSKHMAKSETKIAKLMKVFAKHNLDIKI